MQKVGDTWRVCIAGMCKDHKQEWQAKVFYHQMLSNAQSQVHDLKDTTRDF
jgi:hypothetical protein